MRYLVEGLPGIGPKRAKALQDRFGSLGALFVANEEELIRVEGIGAKTARELHAFLGKPFAHIDADGAADGEKEATGYEIRD